MENKNINRTDTYVFTIKTNRLIFWITPCITVFCLGTELVPRDEGLVKQVIENGGTNSSKSTMSLRSVVSNFLGLKTVD